MHDNADTREQMMQISEKMKKAEMDYREMRRELLGEKETNKRLLQQLETKNHAVNMFQIETESLIK